MTILSRILAVLALPAAVGGATLALVGSSASAASDCAAGADWGTPRGDLASQTIQLVNARRASLGLRQLVVVPALQASADWKARHMARYSYMAHDDPAPPIARSAGARMAACGYGAGWGENIAAGFPSAQAVFDAWISSPGHRANIENPSWVAIGSGAAVSASGQVYWAQTFGTSTAGVTPAPAPPAPAPPAPAPPAPAPPAPAPPAPPPPAPSPSPAPRPPAARQPAPAQPAAPAPQPSAGAEPAAPRSGAVKTAAAAAMTMSGLRLTPRRPQAGRVLRSKVAVFTGASRLRAGHVFCSARFEGRPLRVLKRRLSGGTATCAWRLPARAKGQIVLATMIVEQGRRRVDAPFRTQIS